MNLQQQALYQRLQAYSLDAPEACFSFSQRLARENGWSLAYTHGVIDEYKKFAFLAMVAGHTVSPSAAVDQAWHLHLTYTRSYWNEFCQGILGKPLHHEPSRGGHAEQRRYRQLYQQTLASYERIFAEPPPAEFWPSPEQRFDKAAHYVRVNRQHLWLLPKLRPPRKAMLLLLSVVGVMAGLMTGCSVLQPFDNVLKAWMSAGIGSFLIVNIAVSAWLMMLGSKWLVSIRCATPPSALKLSNLELAYLAGGADRVFQTAIVAMVARGDLTVLTQDDYNGKIIKFRLARRFKAQSEFEQAFANKMTEGSFNIEQWYRFAGDLAQAIRQQLVRKKLLIATPVLKMIGALLFSPLLLLDLAYLIEAILELPIVWQLFGLFSLVLQSSFIVIAITTALMTALYANPQSYYGNQVLAYYQQNQDTAQISTTVAIAGLSGLEGTAYADLAEAFMKPARVNHNGFDSGGDGDLAEAIMKPVRVNHNANPPSAQKLSNLELAFLAGGADRVFQTAIVAMVERGDLTVLTHFLFGKKLEFKLATGFQAQSEFEQAFANKMTTGCFNIEQWYSFAGDLAQAIRQQLVRKKLLTAMLEMKSSYGKQVLAYYQQNWDTAQISTMVAIKGLSGLEGTAYADLAEAIIKSVPDTHPYDVCGCV